MKTMIFLSSSYLLCFFVVCMPFALWEGYGLFLFDEMKAEVFGCGGGVRDIVYIAVRRVKLVV